MYDQQLADALKEIELLKTNATRRRTYSPEQSVDIAAKLLLARIQENKMWLATVAADGPVTKADLLKRIEYLRAEGGK